MSQPTLKYWNERGMTVFGWNSAEMPEMLASLWFPYGSHSVAVDWMVRDGEGKIVAISYDYINSRGKMKSKLIRSRAAITKFMRAAAHEAAKRRTMCLEEWNRVHAS